MSRLDDSTDDPIRAPLSAFRVDIEAIPCDLSIAAPGLGILRAGLPSITGMDAKERAELIKASNAGEHIELEFSAITYRQLDGRPNLKFVRFSPDALSRVARSARRSPFLVDHNQYQQIARMGTVIASEAITASDDPTLAAGETAFRQRILAVKPRAVVSLLDGTIDRFSIGIRPKGKILCAIHRGRARMDCSCWAGQEVEVDGKRRIAEYEFSDAELPEVSAVNSPAVGGTRIDEVRAALAAEIDHYNGRSSPIMTTMPTLAARLGLAATASEAELVTALDARARESEATLAVATQRAANAEQALAPLRAELATALAAAQAGTIDTALAGAYLDGRLLRLTGEDGKQTPDPFEASLRALGSVAPAAFATQLAALPVRAPVGLAAIGVGGPGKAGGTPPGGPAPVQLDAATSIAASQLGLSAEDLAKYGPQNGGK